ncbi:MAG: hypothetical protein M1549_03535 [Candidatus Dependentiae bacterium]|nr:hypothetical protein [Candidatus Dependentiae bacterium]
MDAERKEAKNEKGALISTLSERDQRIFDLENALNKISTEAARLAKELEKACIARTKLAELAEQLEGAKREKDALLAKLEQERKVHDESERTSASRLEQIENKKC